MGFLDWSGESLKLDKFLKEHLYYEFAMLYASKKYVPENVIERNMRYEVFLVHARLLYEFFYKPINRRHPDNARAISYIDNWKPESFPKNVGEKWYEDVSQRLVHLSQKRDTVSIFNDHYLKRVYAVMVSNFDKFYVSLNPTDKKLQRLLKAMKLEVN